MFSESGSALLMVVSRRQQGALLEHLLSGSPLENRKLFYIGQMDLKYKIPSVWDFMRNLKNSSSYGAA
jgi:hypothetical protein